MSNEETRIPIRVHAALDGWPVELSLDLAPARLGAALDRLKALGFTPAAPAAAAPAPAAPARVMPVAPDGSPLACPIHGTAKVREGKRGPFCAAKLPSGDYCTERPI